MTYRLGIETKPPLKELRKQLISLDKANGPVLNKALKAGAEVIAADARTRLSAFDEAIARVSGQIKAGGTAKGAMITITSSSRFPDAVARVMGSDKRTGWYADGRFAGTGGMQFPKWVGSGWKPGGPGGPRGVNPAIAAKQVELVATVDREISRVASSLGL